MLPINVVVVTLTIANFSVLQLPKKQGFYISNLRMHQEHGLQNGLKLYKLCHLQLRS